MSNYVILFYYSDTKNTFVKIGKATPIM